jgi:hypothetical protein
MAKRGHVAQNQMERLLERMGFKNEIPKRQYNNKEFSTKELLDLLDKRTSNRLPGMMKKVSRGILEQQSPKYILDRGYKADFLIFSPKLQGYLLIDFLLYPEDEDWSRLIEKREEITSLYNSGVYDELNIKGAGVLLVEPEGKNDVIDEDLEEEQEDEVYSFLSQLEESKEFLSPTFLIDLRQNHGGLALPPE